MVVFCTSTVTNHFGIRSEKLGYISKCQLSQIKDSFPLLGAKMYNALPKRERGLKQDGFKSYEGMADIKVPCWSTLMLIGRQFLLSRYLISSNSFKKVQHSLPGFSSQQQCYRYQHPIVYSYNSDMKMCSPKWQR